MKIISHILFPFSLILLLVACGGSGRVNEALQSAAELIFVAPDSAVGVLDSLDLTDASRAQRARHALLLTKAREKANIVITDDSLINIAADYYRGRGDSLEVQSLFYRGVILGYRGDYSKALISLMEAADRAAAKSDYFYLAMAYREQADIYYNYSAHSKRSHFAHKAALYFDLANKPIHALWERLGEAYSLVKINNESKALSLLDSIKDDILITDSRDMHSEWLKTYGIANYQNSQFKAAIGAFRATVINGTALTPIDYYIMGLSYRAIGHSDSAYICLKKIENLQSYFEDSLALLHLKSLIKQDSGLFDEALQLKKEYDALRFEKSDSLISHPMISDVSDYYGQQSFDSKKQLSHKNMVLYRYITVCSLFLLIFLFIIFLRNKTIHRLEAQLSKKIEIIELEKETLTTFTRNANEDLFKKLDRWVQTFDHLCSELFRLPSSAKLRSVNLLAAKDTFTIIEANVNHQHNNIMTRFRESMPNLRENQYQLALLLFAGFSQEAICALTGIDRKNTLAVQKHRLKSILIDCAPQNLADFLPYF